MLANVLRYKKSIMLEGAFDSPTKFKRFFGNPNIDIVGLRWLGDANNALFNMGVL